MGVGATSKASEQALRAHRVATLIMDLDDESEPDYGDLICLVAEYRRLLGEQAAKAGGKV